jgi:flagellar basal body-associated protein FliL
MSEKDAKDAAAAAGAKKGGMGGAIVGIVLTAALSGGAAFGGARLAGGKTAAPQESAAKPKVTPPGPTVPLEPFVANVADESGKMRTVRMTIAIELEKESLEDEFKSFVPRIRDVTLSYVRSQSFEQLTKPDGVEATRKALLEKVTAVGAVQARQVLVTDLLGQ